MLSKNGFTLIETIVVMIIIAVTAALCFPNYLASVEQSRAATAQNNLLAIYSAEQNYNNNNGGNNNFCTTSNTPNPEPSCAEAANTTCAPDLASINCNLSLNLQDDGSYKYSCAVAGGVYTCTATRTSINANNTIVLTFNQPINLSATPATDNPQCNLVNSWCPQ